MFSQNFIVMTFNFNSYQKENYFNDCTKSGFDFFWEQNKNLIHIAKQEEGKRKEFHYATGFFLELKPVYVER